MGATFGTLEKAMDILCLFDPEHSELTAQEVAQKLSIPLSTAYKYLQVFHDRKFLSKNGHTNKFFPGLTMLKLGFVAAEKTSILDIASKYLASLMQRSLETAVLTVADGLHVVCVDIRVSSRAVKFITGKGSTMPLYAGSPGKAVLAFKDPGFIDRLVEATGLVRLNKNTITGIEPLKKELALIRKQGFSESDSEIESEVCSVAAPIFDHRGQAIASIAVAGPAERIFRENKHSLIEMVKECAEGISIELGYGGKYGKPLPAT